MKSSLVGILLAFLTLAITACEKPAHVAAPNTDTTKVKPAVRAERPLPEKDDA